MSIVAESPVTENLPPLTSMPSGADSVSISRVNGAIRALLGNSQAATQQNWLRAVARLVTDMRPDIADQIVIHLGISVRSEDSPLDRMSIGEVGVVYEALLALTDHKDRRSRGQYFTPDDVASYMASQASRFPIGTWLDPCCGVGNLSWHLANAMVDAGRFVADRLVLIDLDPVALKTAQAILIASFADRDDREALPKLSAHSRSGNFLGPATLPSHDFVIANPPYARTSRIDRFRSARSQELYAYFVERIATESRGFIAITPASYLGASKYRELRLILEELSGGDVLVLDNVPDTCFRGYKYGSTNSSKTNFVRAAITVSAPSDNGWRVTPILRWATRSRPLMWQGAREFLVPLRKGPAGEWAKVMPGTEEVWDLLSRSKKSLRDLVSALPTKFVLEVASTPRYYVSASQRTLDRGSKHKLYFRTAADMNLAYILINSSLSYWWWRCLDGGITLPIRNLLSLPLPSQLRASKRIVDRLRSSEEEHVVTKLNAGRKNENVRRPREITDAIDSELLEGVDYCFDLVYCSDMFERDRLRLGN